MNQYIKQVSGNTSSPLENFGTSNFIQIYINDVPYFRYGSEKHSKLLENILVEFELPFVSHNVLDNSVDKLFEKNCIPKSEGNNYKLVGEGQINEACLIIKKDVERLNCEIEYYAIFPSNSDYGLFPSITHLNKILEHFNKPLVFASDNYQTQEERCFLSWNLDQEKYAFDDILKHADINDEPF